MMLLEEAAPSDIPAIVALMNEAFRGDGPEASWNSEAAYMEGDRTSETLLAAELADKPQAHLLISRHADGSGIAGSVWLEPLGDETWYLGSLTIDPALQNRGAGRRLLEISEAWIARNGGRRIRMTVVNVRDTLIAWYIRRGYWLTGETEAYPYEDGRFGRPRRDDLHFVVLEKALAVD